MSAFGLDRHSLNPAAFSALTAVGAFDINRFNEGILR
jgi:hypothetical protein